MRNRLQVSLIVLILGLIFSPVRINAEVNAGNGTATVDQILGALGAVVKDRAKQVASEMVLEQIKDAICRGDKLTLKVKVETKSEKKEETKTELYLGGRCLPDTQCKKRYEPNSNDVFFETCRLLTRHNSKLTDPYLLKTLSRETIQFGLRIAVKEMDEDTYNKTKMPGFGNYIFEVMDTMSHKDPDLFDLINPTLDLADQLEENFDMRNFLGEVGDSAETKTLLESINNFLEESCSGKEKWSCDQFTKEKKRWFVGTVAQCTDWVQNRDTREEISVEKFFKPSGEFSAYLNKPCKKPDDDCTRAQLLILLAPALQSWQCHSQSVSTREDFRRLIYIELEKGQYEVAFGGTPARTDFDNWYSKVSILLKTRRNEIQRDLLSNGLRLMAVVLRTYRNHPEETSKWLNRLKSDLDKIGEFNDIRNGEVLGRGNRGSTPIQLLPLRDGIKSLLSVPLAVQLIYPDTTRNNGKQTDSVRRLLSELVKFPNYDRSTSASLRLIQSYIATLSRVLSDPSMSEGNPETLAPFISALGILQKGFKNASDKNWVGLAMDVTEIVDESLSKDIEPSTNESWKIWKRGSVAKTPEIYRTLQFARVLISMYEAKSTEDAKAIFEGELEDIASRKMRYENWSVDVTALAGVTYGSLRVYDLDPGAEDSIQRTRLYGLFAPIGIQASFKMFGVLIYPVDLGSYLTGKSDSSVSSDNASWRDSLRFGSAIYWRASGSVPIVIGAAVDYRPTMDQINQLRYLGFVAIELPLFLIY